MLIEQEYREFIKQVESVRDEVRAAIQPGTREDDLCKGFTILYSRLFRNPPFLFLGINPGAGFFNQTGIKYRDDIDLEPSDTDFEYLEYPGRLADETVQVFESVGLRDLLRGCMKANLHYLVTSSQPDLQELLWLLRQKFGLDLYARSAEWTRDLIRIISPQNILCEGASVIRTLAGYYGKEVSWIDGVGSFDLEDGIRVLGYKRRYSNILSKKELAQAIKVQCGELPVRT
jgi:hypothetical protein